METKYPTTLVDLLRIRAPTQPYKLVYTFLVDNEIKEAKLIYSEFDQPAGTIADQLQSLIAAGKWILLLYPAKLASITIFFGCLSASRIAVPIYSSRRNQTDFRQITSSQRATSNLQHLYLAVNSGKSVCQPRNF